MVAQGRFVVSGAVQWGKSGQGAVLAVEGSEAVNGRAREEAKGKDHLLGFLVHHRCSRVSVERVSWTPRPSPVS